jgi:hypothetical protein
MNPFRVLSGFCLIASVAACGGGSDSATASGGSAPATSNAAAASSGKIDVVPHEKLAAFLPTLPGWTREGDPQGTTDAADGVSRVQVQYIQDAGVASVGIEIMDSSKDPNVLAILRDDLKTNKATRFADFPAVQEWHADAGSGTLGILLADRFVVSITGNLIKDFAILQKTADAIDLKKLAALK